MNDNIKIGCYVSGFDVSDKFRSEVRGKVTGKTNGNLTIKTINKDGKIEVIEISGDTAYICNKSDGWESAFNRIMPIGSVARHFKGGIYVITGYAHGVDGGCFVIYAPQSDPKKLWVREIGEFMSLVDTTKYPNVTQRYRFEWVKTPQDEADSTKQGE